MMKKVLLMLVAITFILVGCGKDDGESKVSGNKEGETEVSEIIKEHLGISAYIPKTDYELGTVILVSHPTEKDLEPYNATISYFESLDELEGADEESIKHWKENNEGNELIYGELYAEPRLIFIEIYPPGVDLLDLETIEIAGHEVQYQFLEGGKEGRDPGSNHVTMMINFEDVGYAITYSAQSDDIEAEAKRLAEDIIKNNK